MPAKLLSGLVATGGRVAHGALAYRGRDARANRRATRSVTRSAAEPASRRATSIGSDAAAP
jgi:hypothetical protein